MFTSKQVFIELACSMSTWFSRLRASEDEQVRLMDSFFDWRKIKGKWKKRGDWHVCSFATDGIKLCITFATGRAPAVTNVLLEGSTP
mmetsp:Transcript_68073/g.120435  ORF Transcript_68073/g.120435 Transcript_68073/m.120435 type:complete len:87 (+) Transcript_68073:988-1248(+)